MSDETLWILLGLGGLAVLYFVFVRKTGSSSTSSSGGKIPGDPSIKRDNHGRFIGYDYSHGGTTTVVAGPVAGGIGGGPGALHATPPGGVR